VLESHDNQTKRIILASVSPRRRKIFADAGYAFETADPGDVEELVTGFALPERLAIEKARAKALAVAERLGPPYPALVVGADTLVAAQGKVIGKPLDRADAAAILSGLSGTRHCVVSGVCVILADGTGSATKKTLLLEFAEPTWVTMRKMSAAEIAAYVDSGQSDGKAGAYAIQENGDKFVEKLEGSFLNVVGFPLERFQAELPAALKSWNVGRRVHEQSG
jgi:septum formation protein